MYVLCLCRLPGGSEDLTHIRNEHRYVHSERMHTHTNIQPGMVHLSGVQPLHTLYLARLAFAHH